MGLLRKAGRPKKEVVDAEELYEDVMEEDLPITPLPPKPDAEEELDEEAQLVAQLETLRAEKSKHTFMQNAPQRLEAVEKAVEDNRKYLIAINNSIKSLKEEIAMLSARK